MLQFLRLVNAAILLFTFTKRVVPAASNERQNFLTVDLNGCCYGDDTIKHGGVVFSHPRRCFQLVCQYGSIQPQYVQEKGDRNCCEFNDILYPDGSEMAGLCIQMKCESGSWKPAGNIDNCCNHCSLYNDPHIVTFDGHRYDWHGKCNYSVAQTEFAVKPEVGVFSDFSVCNGLASCLSHTTFRNDPHTIVTLDNGAVNRLKVNGCKFEVQEMVQLLRCGKVKHPLLSWKHENCVFLLGSSNILLLHCPHRLDVWAHPVHVNKLNGLCGHYNQHLNDDFTDRAGNIHSPLSYWPMAFPYSWMTSEQTDRLCDAPCPECNDETTSDPCEADATQRTYYATLCRKSLQHLSNVKEFSNYIETCAFDLCMIYQSGGQERKAKSWIREVEELITVVMDIQKQNAS